ncbi:glycosyltransferase family 4 protein [Planktotalea sp.]|uniref:glycosyltransferase family 4 protein n=1 Tax=Planktotalea sp. TaxID=2029877 RepID=UPI003D6C35B4
MKRDVSVLVVQLGARRQYAVPAAFAQAGQLEALYTDLCAGRGIGRLAPLIQKIPPVARRINLSRRTPPPDVLARTHVFPSWFLQMRAALSGGGTQGARLKKIRQAHHRASMRMLKSGFGNATHVLTMFGEATAFQRRAKAQGLVTITDMNIAPSTEAIVRDEQRSFPDWEAPKIYYGQAHAAKAGVAPMMDDVLAHTDIFLCPSEFVRSDLINNFGVAATRTRLVPYAVNPKWSAVKARPDVGRVLFAGGAELRKGIHILAAAARILNERGLSYRFDVAGTASVEIRARPECAALTFLGRLNAQDMSAAYSTADIVALPSLAEGSAGVTYEALGCGLPVVTTFEAGSAVRDGIDGKIVPARDASALADAIELIVQNRDLRDSMAKNARAHALELSWAKYSSKLQDALFDPLGAL